MTGSVVYLIGAPAISSGLVKIGFSSKDARSRLSHLQIGSPVKLELLHQQPGTLRDEHAVHLEFEHLRVRGEWFEFGQLDPVAEVVGFLDRPRRRAPAPQLTKAKRPKYRPSSQLLAALAEWREAVALEEEARHVLRKAVAYDMAEYDVSNSEMAEHLPWTSETVRVIGKENGVRPGRRRATRGVKKKLEEST